VLSGGSAFGLDTATGVMRYLEEKGVGFPVSVGKVPIVPAAILYDLGIGDWTIRPDARRDTRRRVPRRRALWPRGASAPAPGRRWGSCSALDWR